MTRMTEEEVLAHNARVAAWKSRQSGLVVLPDETPGQNPQEVVQDSTEKAARRTEASRAGRSVQNQGIGVGEKKIVAPAKPQVEKWKNMNPGEHRFYHDWALYRKGIVCRFNAISFRLSGNEKRPRSYRPDFFVIDEDGLIICYEAKADFRENRNRRESREKFMSARHEYPWITWEAWEWIKEKTWREIWT